MAHKITISGIIGWDVYASDIKEEFSKISPTSEVEIELNSPGGSVFEGIEISNAIKSHKGKTNLVITSFAASMGSYIAMAADHVAAYEDSTFMIHNASTFEWGDHRALRKTANVIESLSKMLSKAYSRKTGQESEVIRGLMDDETWLFGDEIIDAGFVDELITSESEETEEKGDAVAYQKLVFTDSIEKMKTGEKSKGEIDKLAAYFKTNGGTMAASADKSKDLPEKPHTQEKDMTLAEFLAQNATAQAEIDVLVVTAKTEGRDELQAELKALSDKVKPIMASDSYTKRIKTAGFEVMTGERTHQSFADMVAVVDEANESDKSKKVQDKQPDATPGEGGTSAEEMAKGLTTKNAQSLSADINNTNKVT